jgi:SAM-dependent methyltransferase
MANTWMASSSALVEAYARHNNSQLGALRQRLLSRALARHLPGECTRIIDVGGGEGHQAISLARAGYDVVLLDPDPAMLAAAARRLEAETAAVRDRVELVLGRGERARHLVPGQFDAVCCHGILMYLDQPVDMLRSLVGLARPGGLISVLAKNGAALAMRPALEGRWADALATVHGGVDEGGRNVASRADTVENVTGILSAAGAEVRAWYGLRIFSDHLGDAPVGPDFDTLCDLEWQAGCRDPYRQVARLFHLIAWRRDP